MAVAIFSLGSSTFTGWKRRVSAASFSKYFLYSAQVVAAIVRSSPRARAGFRRLAASFWPAWPPAPISVCASSMKRMMGLGLDLVSSITDFRRFSNSPFTPAPACSRPRSSVRNVTLRSAGGTSPDGDAQGEALDDGGLAHARFAGEDRIVLPTTRQDVDHLTDLEVAAEDRVDLAGLGLRREVDRELVEGRRAARPGFARTGARRLRAGRLRRGLCRLDRVAANREIVGLERVGRDGGQKARRSDRAARQHVVGEQCPHQVA